MSGSYNVSGLITGLDSATIIKQLMSIERKPITRLQEQVDTLDKQKTAVRELRTQLLALRNKVQDFRLFNVFSKYQSTTSEEKVLTASVSGTSPVVGAYTVNVTQLASASVARSSGSLGGAINPNVALNSSGITTAIEEGTFTINGVTFNVDPATQSLSDILTAITNSSAGVNATYDSATDTVTFENKTAGDTSLINFGSSDDESNFLSAINVTGATQSTGPNGSTIATSTRNLGAVDVSKTIGELHLAEGAITEGTFVVNGVTISVNASDSLQDILERITDSDAQVTATYDSTSDRIQLVSKTLGSRTVRLTAGTSNFLAVTNLDDAVQTAGNDAQFTINGGAVQSRNTNEIADAISGVTIKLLSTGESTVTVSGDNDAITEAVNGFVEAFNASVDKINELVKSGGALYADASIQNIEMSLRQMVFGQVSGISEDYSSLIDLGISTGDTFDSEAVAHLELDADTLLEALRDDRASVRRIFSNSDETGIADQLFSYLDEATRVTGFLNARSKSNGTIDQQIKLLNDRMDQLEDRVSQKEARLKKQFAQLEQLSSTFQSQGYTISGLSSSFTSFK